MARRRSTIAQWFLIFLFLGFGGAAIAAYDIFFYPNQFSDHEGKVVIIPRGASFTTAVDSLAIHGVLQSRWTLKIAGRLLGYTKLIKTGKYLFHSGQSNIEILKDIRFGKSRMIFSVVIPEGWSMDQIANRYAHELGINPEKFLAFCRDTVFIHRHGIQATTLEGYLFPATYSFYWENDEADIVNQMLEEFKHFYTDSLVQRQNAIHTTQREILTMASIVEAEAAVDSERAVVAGVYWNRLNKNIRLEADPTVQYALGEKIRLHWDDLSVASRYNTYKYEGLPPGPINNPGLKSILAALYPAHHSYLFFVAKGNGGHYFAKTFSEHQKNIRKYHQARRRMENNVP